jgi:hypothetical protein
MRRFLLILLLSLPLSATAVEYDIISYHDVLDTVPRSGNVDRYAVSAEHLVAHFRWLQEGGFTPVSVDQILAADPADFRRRPAQLLHTRISSAPTIRLPGRRKRRFRLDRF